MNPSVRIYLVLDIIGMKTEESWSCSPQGACVIMGGGVVEVLGPLKAQREEPSCTLTTMMPLKAKDVDIREECCPTELSTMMEMFYICAIR